MCDDEASRDGQESKKKREDKQWVRKKWSSGGAQGINGSSYWGGEIKKAEESYQRAF